jgi:hypothetical protein
MPRTYDDVLSEEEIAVLLVAPTTEDSAFDADTAAEVTGQDRGMCLLAMDLLESRGMLHSFGPVYWLAPFGVARALEAYLDRNAPSDEPEPALA